MKLILVQEDHSGGFWFRFQCYADILEEFLFHFFGAVYSLHCNGGMGLVGGFFAVRSDVFTL